MLSQSKDFGASAFKRRSSHHLCRRRMTPDKIVSKFSAALNNFKPITDQPSDSDLTRLWEAISPLLLQIPYEETSGTHNLIT